MYYDGLFLAVQHYPQVARYLSLANKRDSHPFTFCKRHDLDILRAVYIGYTIHIGIHAEAAGLLHSRGIAFMPPYDAVQVVACLAEG